MSDNSALLLVNRGPDYLDDSHSNENQFHEILRSKSLMAVLQLIVDFNSQSIYGYESLIHGPSDSRLQNPMPLFDTAKTL